MKIKEQKTCKGYYVNMEVLENGDLIMFPTPEAIEEKEYFLSLPSMSALYELLEDFLCNGWGIISPEDIGALTDAPIITNEIDRDDDGHIIHLGDTWWFPNYQIENEIELLLNGKVVFIKE